MEVSGNHPDIEDGAKKMQEAMYKMYEGYKMNELTGKTPAGEDIYGAQQRNGKRESAVRQTHEHRLLRCGGPYGRPPDE